MSVQYIGKSSVATHDNIAYTPPSDATFFLIALRNRAAGGGGTQWAGFQWVGAAETQDCTELEYRKTTGSNSALAALWYLQRPDVSGAGVTNDSAGGGDGVILAYKGVKLFGDPSGGNHGNSNNTVTPTGWKGGAAIAAAISHGDSNETPVSGFTEVVGWGTSGNRGAAGHRFDDGDVGWGSHTEEALVWSILEGGGGASSQIMISMFKAWDSWQKRVNGLLAPKGFDIPVLVPTKEQVNVLA